MTIADFADMMPTTATFANVASTNIYGKKTAGAPVSFKCHISRNNREVYTPEGVIIVKGGSIQMDGIYAVQDTAVLTLPDGSTPKIIAVKTFYDESGAHHTSIDFEG